MNNTAMQDAEGVRSAKTGVRSPKLIEMPSPLVEKLLPS